MSTTYEIARKANVSQATVSFVLNNRYEGVRISDSTRQRVLNIAAELGYRSNGAAKAMSSGKFGCAALLTSTRQHHSYVPDKLLHGIHDALCDHDLHLTMAVLSDDRLTDESFVPKILRECLADGLLIDYIQDIPTRLVELIGRHKIPAVWINAKRPADCVYPDDVAAAREATRRLIELGHRDIAWLNYVHGYQPANYHYSVEDRKTGYLEAMGEAGLPVRFLQEKAPIPIRERVAYSRAWLSQPDRPTAVVAYFPQEALCAAAYSLGLKVPEDLSILTFGNPNESFAGQPFTLMAEPNAAVGKAAVDMLKKKIEAPDRSFEPVSVPFGFSPGDTVAPLAGALKK